jgi:hypothetical protein
MAFHAATEWDVRTTGNDANGGGWQVGSTGTDRSQSDAAYQAYTDIVIDHTANTKITSAAHPFDATSVGNILNITAGTGFTVQRVQIVSEAAGVATCDKAVGTIDSTGGTGNLGGSLLTVQAAVNLVVDGNRVHVKAGTYTITTKISLSHVQAPNMEIVGYGATHDDHGTRPLITTATNSTRVFDMVAVSATRGGWRLAHLSLSNTASVRAEGIYPSAGNDRIEMFIEDNILDGFTTAIPYNATIVGNEIKNCTNGISTDASFVKDNWIHDNSAYGITGIGTYDYISIIGNLITHNNIGVNDSGSYSRLHLYGNTVAFNTSHGVQGSNDGTMWWLYVFENNIFYGNGGYGVRLPAGLTYVPINRNNAYGANTPAGRYNLGVGYGDVTLTADPFTDSATDDYSLNSTAGGGAACKNAGFKWGA